MMSTLPLYTTNHECRIATPKEFSQALEESKKVEELALYLQPIAIESLGGRLDCTNHKCLLIVVTENLEFTCSTKENTEELDQRRKKKKFSGKNGI